MEIGLYLFTSYLASPLWIGVTLASFHSSGNTAVCIEKLNRSHSNSEIIGVACLSMLLRIWSRSVAFLSGIEVSS